ncbi:zinc finger protein ADR1 [Xylogone sp. PMI_703]|nr:zinc finger protein ADR1 [Xylogone sp. PMI_703]
MTRNAPSESPSTADSPPLDEKSLKCKFCQRSFTRLEHHTNEKPYRCLQCPRSFTRSDLLFRHKNFSHGDGGSRNVIYGYDPAFEIRETGSYQRTVQVPGSSQFQPETANFAEENTELDIEGRSGSNLAQAQQLPSHFSLSPLMNNLDGNTPSTDFITETHRPKNGFHDLDSNFTSAPIEELSTNLLSNFLDNSALEIGSFDNLNWQSWFYAANLYPVLQLPYVSPGLLWNNPGSINVNNDLSGHFSQPDGSTSHPLMESQLPSSHPESAAASKKHHAFWSITAEVRESLSERMAKFSTVIPQGFTLPTCHTLSRYMAGYTNGFHDHLPFLHIPTFETTRASPELILAIAAVGGKYCFEHIKAVELFKVSKAIVFERIRVMQELRDARLLRERSERSPRQCREDFTIPVQNDASEKGNEDGTHGRTDSPRCNHELMENAQTLLLLMALATWSGTQSMHGEALVIQSTLAALIREHKLLCSEDITMIQSWKDWIRFEGAKRTLYMIYCFFNFHSILYNTAPAILNTELDMRLPCDEKAWKSPTETAWKESYRISEPEPKFQEQFLDLFSDKESDCSLQVSSLGGYILIHALIQQIFFARQLTRFRPNHNGNLSSQDISTLEHALRKWQHEWKRNPESSLDPQDPHGPVPFTSTALLRIAYIRIHMDVGSCLALESHDPQKIANTMLHSPAIIRGGKLTQAAMHCAHALSIPIRLGINLISRNQIFTWSLQHSVCSLECAFLLSKWLDSVTGESSDSQQLDEYEKKVLDFIVNMLAESDSDVPSIIDQSGDTEAASSDTRLSARVVKVWAKLFHGERVWGVINVVGKAMYVYGDLLEDNQNQTPITGQSYVN